MMDVSVLLKSFVDAYGKLFLTLLGLTLADVLSGIFSAVKRGEFHWDQVANFYRTTIVPKVGGLAVVLFLVKVLSLGAIPKEYVVLFDGVSSYASVGLVLVDYARSIFSNLREIFTPAVPKTVGH